MTVVLVQVIQVELLIGVIVVIYIYSLICLFIVCDHCILYENKRCNI